MSHPSILDWNANPQAAHDAAVADAAQLASDAKAAGAIVSQIASQIIAVAGPIAEGAIAVSPAGPGVAAAVAAALAVLQEQMATPTAPNTLTPVEQAAVTAAIQAGVQAVSAKLALTSPPAPAKAP